MNNVLVENAKITKHQECKFLSYHYFLDFLLPCSKQGKIFHFERKFDKKNAMFLFFRKRCKCKSMSMMGGRSGNAEKSSQTILSNSMQTTRKPVTTITKSTTKGQLISKTNSGVFI